MIFLSWYNSCLSYCVQVSFIGGIEFSNSVCVVPNTSRPPFQIPQSMRALLFSLRSTPLLCVVMLGLTSSHPSSLFFCHPTQCGEAPRPQLSAQTTGQSTPSSCLLLQHRMTDFYWVCLFSFCPNDISSALAFKILIVTGRKPLFPGWNLEARIKFLHRRYLFLLPVDFYQYPIAQKSQWGLLYLELSGYEKCLCTHPNPLEVQSSKFDSLLKFCSPWLLTEGAQANLFYTTRPGVQIYNTWLLLSPLFLLWLPFVSVRCIDDKPLMHVIY